MDAACPVSILFSEWLVDAGVVTHGIEAAFVEQGWRGIISIRDIPAGALLLQVPEKVLMTTINAMKDALFASVILQQGTDLSQEQVLCVHFLHEASKGSDSSWQHYITQMPHEYSLMQNFRQLHIEALQVPYAQNLAKQTCSQARQEWKAAAPLLQALGVGSKWCSLKAWLWAAATVCSRTMHVPFSPAGALAPFGDLHNYQPPPAPHYPVIDGVIVEVAEDRQPGGGQEGGDGGYHEAFQEYCLYARRRYQAGEQIFLCYGKYTNLELLEHYGFVLADNPHDQAEIPLTAFPATFAAYISHRHPSCGHCWLHCNGIPGWQLLQDLRCCVASPAERKKLGHTAAAGMRISIAGDLKVFEMLKAACLKALSQLGTSLKQDALLLRDASAEPCLHAALSWRLTYKRCIVRGVLVADDALSCLRAQPS